MRARRRLGSRLYFEFTAKALGDAAEWERVAVGMAQEVRRHGAPLPSSAAQAGAEAIPHQQAVGAVAVAAAAATVAAAVPKGSVAVGPPPTSEAAAGVSVRSVAHNHCSSATIYANKNKSTTITNSNTNNIVNTSIMLM